MGSGGAERQALGSGFAQLHWRLEGGPVHYAKPLDGVPTGRGSLAPEAPRTLVVRKAR